MDLTQNITRLVDELPLDRFAKLSQSIYFQYTRANPAPRKETAPAQVEEGVPHDTVITVDNLDCVRAAMDLVTKHKCKRVGILNMANEWNVGGGFERVGGSQEEYLFRATSLCLSLWPHRRQTPPDERWPSGEAKIAEKRNACIDLQSAASEAPPSFRLDRKPLPFYPFSEAGGVLTPYLEPISVDGFCTMVPLAQRSAEFARALTKAFTPVESEATSVGDDTETAGPKASQPFSTDISDYMCMLSIAAQDLRKDAKHYKGEEFSHELTTEKFRTVFHMAREAGCDGLVLGAIGCGAFANPKKSVAIAFKNLLDTEYKNSFARVSFAIIKNRQNLEAFQEVFGDATIVR